MILPSRFFLRHFEESSLFAHRKLSAYPADIEDDFRFDFVKNGDYTIKCSNGDLKANRQALYLSSLFFRNFLPSSHSKEFTVRYSIDAVKPIIWYFHSLCFQMHETYELEFVRRIIDVIEFFHPNTKLDLLNGVHRSLCQKLADDPSPDFDTVLQLASLASKHRLQELKNMACSLLANEFYGKFKAAFPEGEQNITNPRYRDLFMTQHFIGQTPFDYVEKIYRTGFRTNAPAIFDGAKAEVDQKIVTRNLSTKLSKQSGYSAEDLLYPGIPNSKEREKTATNGILRKRKEDIFESFEDFQKQLEAKRILLQKYLKENGIIEEKRPRRNQNKRKFDVVIQTPENKFIIDPLNYDKLMDKFYDEMIEKLDEKLMKISIPLNLDESLY